MQNKTVLITGSSKGLGAALARVFASHGYDLIIHGRNENDLEQVRASIRHLTQNITIVPGDIRLPETIERLEQTARQNNAQVLINNAGIGQKISLDEINVKQIEEIISTNLISAVLLTQRMYRFFLEQKGGAIININSMSGREGHFLRTIYCASKWGLRGFSESLRREAQTNNIQILDVYPTRIKTIPEYTEGMEPEDVANKIYDSFVKRDVSEIVLDGRPKR